MTSPAIAHGLLTTPGVTERWGVAEISLLGPTEGDPVRETELSARLTGDDGREISVEGFYDGDGRYVVRFSPDAEGDWSFMTHSNRAELDGHAGRFRCAGAGPGNHGPVGVDARFHFAYRDGTRYVPVGPTCYASVHQPEALQELTLRTLRTAPFNKLRMCVFPKHFTYNENEPPLHPFEIGADGRIDPCHPDPAYFRHLERRIADLRDMGIEADLILFHPYDRWGYAEMSEKDDIAYLRYVVARLGAFRNVWWSVANEYDFMLDRKPLERWDRLIDELRSLDPYRRLTSIHNGVRLYDHARAAISHVSIQDARVDETGAWRVRWSKPVINDEPQYEGDIPDPWGNISAQELVHRMWVTAVRGGYASHGETYLTEDHQLWWAKGGELRGQSPDRIAFLRKIMEESAGPWEPLSDGWEWSIVAGCDAGPGERIIYFGTHQPRAWSSGLPLDRDDVRLELIDPWAMTIEPLALSEPPSRPFPRTIDGRPGPVVGVELPARPYLALRIRWG
jgi:hypothetical protein